MDLFEGCERRFYYEKIERLSSPEGAPLVVGSCYHEVLADMWRLPPKDDLNETIDRQLERDRDKLVAAGVDLQGLRPEMIENIARLQMALFPDDGCAPIRDADGVPVIERKFSDSSLGYRGVIDLLSTRMPLTNSAGGVVGFCDEEGVLDYKVVSGDRRRSERDARFSTQLALYCLVTKVKRAAFVEIPRNLDRPILVRGAVFTDKELENARRYLVEVRAAIKGRGVEMLNFKRAERSYPLCSVQWCPFFERCYTV